jgi:DNA-binding NtrC family response regulator
MKTKERQTILVVDDEPLVLQMTQLILDSLGFRVQQATNGAEAMTCIEASKGAFDLIILDQQLPDCKGTSVMKRAKNLFPSLRFLLISGFVTRDLVEEANMLGGAQILDKPYDIDDLTKAVHEALAL